MGNLKNMMMLALGALLLGVLSFQSYSLIQNTQKASSLDAPGVQVPLGRSSASSVATVITLAPVSITSTSATLNSSINPNGQQVYGWFLYGASPSSLAPTQKKVVAGEMKPVQFSQTLQNLSPNKKYFFEVCAEPIPFGETACSSTLEFTTLP